MFVGLALLAVAAAAAEPTPDFSTRATGLAHQYKSTELAALASARLAEDPDEIEAHYYLIAASTSPYTGNKELLRQAYARWAAQAPADPVRRLALAYATAALGQPRGRWGDPRHIVPRDAGPWCDAVRPLLAVLPADPALTARQLLFSWNVAQSCGDDPDPLLAALAELSPTTSRDAVRVAWARLNRLDPVDADLMALVERCLAERPEHMASLLGLWRDEAQGPQLEAARAAVLARARALSQSPERVYADAADRVLAAETRRKAPPAPADPAHVQIPYLAAVGQLDPAKRIAAVDALSHKERKEAWGRGEIDIVRAETLEQLGRDAEALRAWGRAWKRSYQDAPNRRYAELALRTDAVTRQALRATSVLVGWAGRPRIAAWHVEEDRRAWARQQGADQLLHARVQLALGRTEGALRSATQSLALDPSADAHLVIGLSMPRVRRFKSDFGGPAAQDHLTRGLAMGGDARLEAQARLALEKRLSLPENRLPVDLDGYVEGARWLLADEARAAEAQGAAAATEPRRLSSTLLEKARFTVDGASRQLADYPGPVVVDVWATWCGPCVVALPQVEAAARRNQDAGLQVLLLSVDRDPAAAAAHVGDTPLAAVAAWGGPDLMEQVGITGIPHTWVLDADHRVVDHWSGFGGDASRLESAIQRALKPVLPQDTGRDPAEGP